MGHLSHSGIKPAVSFAPCYCPGVGKRGQAYFLSPVSLSFLLLVFGKSRAEARLFQPGKLLYNRKEMPGGPTIYGSIFFMIIFE
jgi:hypothetical protein